MKNLILGACVAFFALGAPIEAAGKPKHSYKDAEGQTFLSQLNEKNAKRAKKGKKEKAVRRTEKRNLKLREGHNGSLPPRTARLLQAGFRLINDAGAKAYIEGIVDKLLASWHGTRPDYRVVLMADLDYGAKSDGYGMIIVPIGLLLKVGSEDELAAVIGHELGHILLGHHGHKEASSAQKKFAKLASTALTINDYVRHSSTTRQSSGIGVQITLRSKNADKYALAAYTFQVLSDHVLSTAWSRKDENDADLLGADLAIAAGYKRSAAVSSFAKIYEVQLTRSAEMDQVQSMAVLFGAKKIVRALGDTSDIVQTIAVIGVAKIGESIFSGLRKGDTDYYPPEEREAHLLQYIGTAYARERSKTRLVTAPLTTLLSEQGETGERINLVAAAIEATKEAQRLVAENMQQESDKQTQQAEYAATTAGDTQEMNAMFTALTGYSQSDLEGMSREYQKRMATEGTPEPEDMTLGFLPQQMADPARLQAIAPAAGRPSTPGAAGHPGQQGRGNSAGQRGKPAKLPRWVPSGKKKRPVVAHEAAYSYLVALGYPDAAQDYLATAAEQPGARLSVYSLRSDYLAANGRHQDALEILELAQGRLGSSNALLPQLVTALIGLGRKKDAEDTAMRCKKEGGDEMHTSCMERLGYDVAAERKAATSRLLKGIKGILDR
jgi:predicted Zn-dependent protease